MIKCHITENLLQMLHHNKMKGYNQLSKICDGLKQNKTSTGAAVVINWNTKYDKDHLPCPCFLEFF